MHKNSCPAAFAAESVSLVCLSHPSRFGHTGRSRHSGLPGALFETEDKRLVGSSSDVPQTHFARTV